MWDNLQKAPWGADGTWKTDLTYSLRACTATNMEIPHVTLWCHTCDRWVTGSTTYSVEQIAQRISAHEEQDTDHRERIEQGTVTVCSCRGGSWRDAPVKDCPKHGEAA